MKKLNVPFHLQALDSEDCGPTGTLMILDYYGITSDASEVLHKVPRCKFGTSSFENAVTLLNYGLKVEMIIAQPNLFNGDFIDGNPSIEDIKKQINKVKSTLEDDEKIRILDSLIDFTNKGGEIKLQIPSKQHIVDAIENKKPVWVSLYTESLGENQGGYHTVVVSGYDDNKFCVLNPWQPSRRSSWENADKLIYGIHTSTLFDYDNGVLLVVGKSS